eukprot:1364227-Amphidinium_carterae.1
MNLTTLGGIKVCSYEESVPRALLEEVSLTSMYLGGSVAKRTDSAYPVTNPSTRGKFVQGAILPNLT